MDARIGADSDARIRAIASGSVHRICAGQVVLDAATAVKELVENSLDAGATNVEIKVKEYGAESIEVADNGQGIKPEDFPFLAKKHHTSKITQFSDLENVRTFGFRGEALSSLCALSEMSVITRTKEQTVAHKLEFDSKGNVLNQEDAARAVGTTVAIRNLFKPLPVRQREFKRNLKRDYAKMLSVLQSYAVISEGVRFVCTNHSKQGGRQTVVHTQEGATMHANLVTIFGSKTASSMIPIHENLLEGYLLQGFLSKCSPGSGRAAGDRQFFYVGKRPVDLPRFGKVLNEVYKNFNNNQYPSAILDLTPPPGTFDVNVTPDKRKVFLLDEDKLLCSFKGALERLYQPAKYTIPLNDIGLDQYSTGRVDIDKEGPRRLSQATLCFSPLGSDVQQHSGDDVRRSTAGKDRKEVPGKDGAHVQSGDDTTASQEEQDPPCPSQLTENAPTYRSCPGTSTPSRSIEIIPSLPDSCEVTADEAKDADNRASTLQEGVKETGISRRQAYFKDHPDTSTINAMNAVPTIVVHRSVESSKATKEPVITEQVRASDVRHLDSSKVETDEEDFGPTSEPLRTRNLEHECGPACHCFDLFNLLKLPGQVPQTKSQVGEFDRLEEQTALSIPGGTSKPSPDMKNGAETMIPVSLDLEEHEIDNLPAHNQIYVDSHPYQDQRAMLAGKTAGQSDNAVVFDWQGLKHSRKRSHENLSQPGGDCSKKYLYASLEGLEDSLPENKEAEAELERVFKKQDFKRMKVVGQFNLGFIICRLGEDLFIVDQHASDEIKNFERLQKTVVLNKQPLLHPLTLDLSPADRVVMAENLEVFQQNGFEIKENIDAPENQRWSLASVPFSKNVTFGPEDVYEIVSSLRSTGGVLNGQIPRPSKVRAMLAMRACRSSIMIGKPLHHEQMKKVVESLSDLDAPWNCPHGRPTMRHLADLQALKRRRT